MLFVSPKRVLLVSVKTSVVDLVHNAPLGLMGLAAYVRENHEGYTFDIVDQKIGHLTNAAIARLVVDGGYGVLGLSCFTAARDHAVKIARMVREKSPEVKIVVGGPLANSDREKALLPEFDYVVYGEGEIPFTRLLTTINEGGNLADVPGLIYRDPETGQVRTNEPPEPLVVDDLPEPAWDVIDLPLYWHHQGFGFSGHRRYAALMSSRGCPYRCAYCHRIFGRRFRARSPENVLREMKNLRRRYGVKEFEFLDDAFNIDRDRAAEILDRIAKEIPGARLLFPNGLRIDLLDEEMIDKLEKAGTYYLSFALETASPRLQKLIRKNIDFDRFCAAMASCAKRPILLNGFFMLGFPTETREEMQATVDFACASPLHMASFFFVMPFRGTTLFEMLPQNIQERLADAHHQMLYDNPFINLSQVSDKELLQMQRRAMRRFYSNPGRVWRFFRTHPHVMDVIGAFGLELAHKTYTRILVGSRGSARRKAAESR